MLLAVDVDTREIWPDVAGQQAVSAAWHDEFFVAVRFERGGKTFDLGGTAAATGSEIQRRSW
jgi:hypothetical protein